MPSPVWCAVLALRRCLRWHPDGMSRLRAVPLLGAFVVVSACGGSKGDASTHATAGTPAQGSRALHLVRVGTFNDPVFVTSPPGDTRRLMVVEEGGGVRGLRGGRPAARPVPGISSPVGSGGGAGLRSPGPPP